MKFSAKTVAKVQLPKGRKDFAVFDGVIPGFGLRLRDSGSRTWIFQYKIGDKHRRMVIVRANAITPDKAREIASELHAKIKLGGDPANEKSINKVRASNSLGDVTARYLDIKRDELRPRSYAEVERHLVQNIASLRAVPVTAIDRLAIADALSRIAKDN